MALHLVRMYKNLLLCTIRVRVWGCLVEIGGLLIMVGELECLQRADTWVRPYDVILTWCVDGFFDIVVKCTIFCVI